MSTEKAENYLHAKPENLNCAQSILRAWQKRLNIPESTITEFRAWGSGRAPEGLCGALYAANFLSEQEKKDVLTHEFKQIAGALTCKDLKKGKKVACSECVRIADELLKKNMK